MAAVHGYSLETLYKSSKQGLLHLAACKYSSVNNSVGMQESIAASDTVTAVQCYAT